LEVIILKEWFPKWIVIIICIFVLAACSNKKESSSHQLHTTANGDTQEATSSISVLPSFLINQRTEIRQVYQIAAENIDVLQWIPCYCGCGESAGHKSNQNCFIKEVQSDGTVIWDDHGTRCETCMEIALQTAVLKKQGKTNKEIRTLIDETYNEGYVKPTLTKMPV
jgi:hypothetical protein